jgi:hypothetical protein
MHSAGVWTNVIAFVRVVVIFGSVGCPLSAAESRSVHSLDPDAGVVTSSQSNTSVPTWDATALGPLPRQGIACVDVNNDASRIAVGTIASPGDPNVFVLDAEGRLLRQSVVGKRWIDQVDTRKGQNTRRIDSVGRLEWPLATSLGQPRNRVSVAPRNGSSLGRL